MPVHTPNTDTMCCSESVQCQNSGKLFERATCNDATLFTLVHLEAKVRACT